MTGFSFTANGQLVAAIVTLIDAIFGVLVVLNVVHFVPNDALVTVAVTIAFNAAGYIWALLQHRQAVTMLHYRELRAAREYGSTAKAA